MDNGHEHGARDVRAIEQPSVLRQLSTRDLCFQVGLNLPGLNQAIADLRQRFCVRRDVCNWVGHGHFLLILRFVRADHCGSIYALPSLSGGHAKGVNEGVALDERGS